MTLGQRISQYRKQLGISQEILGERLGVSRQAVSKWETDAATPDMENLLALAREFGVSVAELTQTPEEREIQTDMKEPPSHRFGSVFWPMVWAILTVLLVGTLSLTAWLNRPRIDPNEEAMDGIPSGIDGSSGREDSTPSNTEQTVPVPAPETEFALLWYGTDGNEEFLELGVQDGFFPFGTTLEMSAPEIILDTDFHLTDLHVTTCGAISMDYLHMEEDLEYDPNSPTRESILRLATIAPSVRTPRGIHAGSTKAQVMDAYGDELVYCLKESGNYTLVQHDYYYIYQPDEAFSKYLAIYMRDGLVAGLWMEDLIDAGNDFFDPDHVYTFPVVNGEPDFSLRQEPERENRSDTWKVYHAWNQLVTNSNLSAEEVYTYRWTIFSLLSEMDWQEFGSYGFGGTRGESYEKTATIEALIQWLHEQAPYTDSEIFRIQMGCTAKGLDGAYTDMYCHLLSSAFFSNPIGFAKGLAIDSVEDTMTHVLHFTAYDAELYPVELKQALELLDTSIENGTFNEKEMGWAKLLRLYLITPIEDRHILPSLPSELQ